jgi:cytochrome c5
MVFILAGVAAAAAQNSRMSLADGAYTAAQAGRGKITYDAKCAGCHKADLSGVADKGPTLSGDTFLINWETETLDRLFTKISETMPPRDLGSGPSDEDAVDLVAFILERNGYPAGSRQLKPGRGLNQIEVVRMPGRTLSPPTNFAFVQTVGCLTHGPGTGWTLKGASDPVLTRDQPATATALKNAAATSPGPHTFVLLSVAALKPESYDGRKVEAKGLVYRSPDENLLDVTSLQAVASGCQTN